MLHELPDLVRLYAEWYKAAHGYNPFEKYQCPTCKQLISLMAVYRCYDCHAGYCVDCLKAHCADSRQHSNKLKRENTQDIEFCESCKNFVRHPTDDDKTHCSKGHRMRFMVPHDYADMDNYGFYKKACSDRDEIQHEG